VLVSRSSGVSGGALDGRRRALLLQDVDQLVGQQAAAGIGARPVLALVEDDIPAGGVAVASTASAEAAAASSAWTRTRPKSWPKPASLKRDSMKLRVALSRGRPGWLSVWLTMGGAVVEPASPELLRWMFRCLRLHCSHRPSGPAGRPQAQVRRWTVSFSGIRITCSATRSASCSYRSPGALTWRLNWMADRPAAAQRGVCRGKRPAAGLPLAAAWL
jgi:hypothetical protein